MRSTSLRQPVREVAIRFARRLRRAILTFRNRLDVPPPPPPPIPAAAIVTTCLLAKPDPQRQRNWAKDCVPASRGWRTSVARVGALGVILYDCLPSNAKRQFASKSIRLVRVRRHYRHSTNDHRFFLYQSLLRSYAFQSIFFTDLFDVEVVRNPFQHHREARLYIGLDQGLVGSSGYLAAVAKRLGDKDLLDWLAGASDVHVLNAGVFGGEREIVSAFVDLCCSELMRLNRPDINANMLVVNSVARRYFGNVLETEICSRFKKYEKDRLDVTFVHK